MKKGVNLTLILLIIGVIILISVIVGKNTSTKKSENQNKNEVEENVIDNEFYEELEDGTKINTSAKLKESKKINKECIFHFCSRVIYSRDFKPK